MPRGRRWGNVAIVAARAGAKVTGLDLVPELLDAARERAAAERLDKDGRRRRPHGLRSGGPGHQRRRLGDRHRPRGRDPCYHLACDTYPSNINSKVLDIMSDAVAHAVLTFSQTTSAVRGTDKASSSATKPHDWKGDHLRR